MGIREDLLILIKEINSQTPGVEFDYCTLAIEFKHIVN